jgi:WD40 repeat protein
VIQQKGARCLAVSPDGRYLACGTSEGKVVLFDTTTWTALRSLEGHGDSVTAVAFAPDGRVLATGSDDTLVKLWTVPEGGLRLTISAGAKVNAVSFAPRANLLAVGKDTRLQIYDTLTGTSVKRFDNRICNAVSFSPNGNLVAAASLYDVQLLDTASWSKTATFKAGGSVSDVAFSPNGELLAVSCWDSESVRIYKVSTRSLVNSLEAGQMLCLAFDPSSRLLAMGRRNFPSGPAAVRIWKAAENEVGKVADLAGHEASVGSVVFDPRGNWLASCASDGTIRVWRVP